MSQLPIVSDNRLTYSRLRRAKSCLRKHFLLYELALKPEREAAPLRMGAAFHKGQELAARLPADEAILQAVADYDAGPPLDFDEEQAHGWWIERETVARLLAGHFWRWSEMERQMEVIWTEKTFEIPLVNPETGQPSRTWLLAGKRDKVVRLPDGRLAIVEYKTTSSDLARDGDYWKRLVIDSQVSLYWLSALDDGLGVETVLYDVTRKPTIRPREVAVTGESGKKIVMDSGGERVFNQDGAPRQSASSKQGYELLSRMEMPEEYGTRLTEDLGRRPDYYFGRREIPRLQGDLDEARYELWQWGKILRECQRHGRWPRNTGACMGFGRCVCWDLCTGGFDPADGIVPEGWMQVEDVHPELSVDEN